MPDRELPPDVVSRLSAELEAGAPLRSPMPAHARYATASAAQPDHVQGGQRWATAAVAALTLLLIAIVAVPAVMQNVGNHRHNVVTPAGGETASPQRTPDASATPAQVTPSNKPSPTPQAQQTPVTESPEPHESPEPSGTPEAHESPEPSASPGQSPPATPTPSPGASPTPDS